MDTEQALLRKAAEATDDAARLDEALVQGTKRLAAQADFAQYHTDFADQAQIVQVAVLREGKEEVGSPTAVPATGGRLG